MWGTCGGRARGGEEVDVEPGVDAVVKGAEGAGGGRRPVFRAGRGVEGGSLGERGDDGVGAVRRST